MTLNTNKHEEEDLSQTSLASSKENEDRKDFVLLQDVLRDWWVEKVMAPLEHYCVKKRMSPNTLTLAGVGVSFFCFLLYANGSALWAGWLVLLNGSLDILDGRVARATNRVTQTGAYLDSVTDRYQDFFLLAGLAVYYHNSWVFYFVLLALGGTMFVPYTRAKAESMSVTHISRVGVMKRPERIFLLGFGSIVGSLFQISLMPFYGKGNPPPQHLLIMVIIALAVATNLTAIKRIRYAMRELDR